MAMADCQTFGQNSFLLTWFAYHDVLQEYNEVSFDGDHIRDVIELPVSNIDNCRVRHPTYSPNLALTWPY